MILSPNLVLKEYPNIIQPLSTREQNNPEGVGFDLRVNNIYEIANESGFLGISERKTPSSTQLLDTDGIFTISNNKSYLIETIEQFNLPPFISARFYPRSTLFRSGILFQSSILANGYIGPMIFMIHNSLNNDFFIEKTARFSHVVFEMVNGDVNSYKGQWQYGRVSKPDIEEQI